MHMPRLTVTFDEEHWITLRRLARVQGRSASAIIRELVEAVEPGLRRAADLGEAAAEATDDELDALRRAVAQVDEELALPMASALGLATRVIEETDDIVLDMRKRRREGAADDPRPVITGVKFGAERSDKGTCS